MAKVTSKLQLTIPKAIANAYGIKPGDELEWEPAGHPIRVIPPNSRQNRSQRLSLKERLDLFRLMLMRQKERETHPPQAGAYEKERPWKPHEIARGWRHEDLYTRGRSH